MMNCYRDRLATWFAKFALIVCVVAVVGVPMSLADGTTKPPAVGDAAADFELQSLRGGTVKLSDLIKEGPVVLVVLRGYPGYQCPICSLQVGDLRKHADDFAKAGAKVVLVYPGPAEELTERAEEFMNNKSLPEGFEMVLDPDYKFTHAYHLRWDAPRETAYPSTFVIDESGKIRYAKVSKTHAGRAAAKDVVKALP